jgi:hypothetical protein
MARVHPNTPAEGDKNKKPRTDMKTRFNINNIALIVLCVLALSPAALFAKNTTKTAVEHGIIKSVDNSNQQLVVTDHKTKTDRTFQWNDQTKFTEHGKMTSASDLKAGEHLKITYEPGKGTIICASATQAKSGKHSHAYASTHTKG